jgi:glutathione S-transferase
MEASRIDSFLDATLVFGREAQVYLLGINEITAELHQRMSGAFDFFLEGIERALQHDAYVAGNEMTIADIAFACDLSQFMRERLMQSGLDAASLPLVSEDAESKYPCAYEHLFKLIAQPQFAPHLKSYTQHFLPDAVD